MTEREGAQDAKLLPCPFCGSEPILHQESLNPFSYRPVECPNKACHMSRAWPSLGAWQSRPTPPADARDEMVKRQAAEVAVLHATIATMHDRFDELEADNQLRVSALRELMASAEREGWSHVTVSQGRAALKDAP